MTEKVRFWLAIVLVSAVCLYLGWLTVIAPPSWHQVVLMLGMAVAIAYSVMFSIPLGGGKVSLMPMMVLTTYLIGGSVVAGWAVVVALLGQALDRWRKGRDPLSQEPRGKALVEATAFNLAMHLLAILAASAVFDAMGGTIPFGRIPYRGIKLGIATSSTYLAVNYALAFLVLGIRSPGTIREFIHSLPRLLVYEGLPLALSPLAALTYARMGVGYFMLFIGALLTSSTISHRLATASRGLHRRIQELNGLQAVGRVLSSSLDQTTIVNAIYEQISRLMPATSFYVALYDPESEMVSFPLVIDEGRRVSLQARRARRGLTEHVIETRQTLWLPNDVGGYIESHGLEHIRREASCWLGVPLVAADEVLGVIALLSHGQPVAYDPLQIEVLETIAAQAAVAIQNARLYERTDEALAQRVQELDSVLRTTRDGILLLDRAWRVLAVNRALADFIGVAQQDIGRHPIDALWSDGEPLATRLRYTMVGLKEDCRRLEQGEAEMVQGEVVLASGVHVERTLTPVHSTDGTITGWLVVLRDLTEELALARMREELTNMLVHDLRSPISLILASLDLIGETHELGDDEQVSRLVEIARGGGRRVLSLVDELLDIAQLERGYFPLRRETLDVGELLVEVAERFTLAAERARITLAIEHGEGLPHLYADRSMIVRVLSNLVDNALKFTPDKGEVTLWARYDRDAAPDELILGVSDTGPGIPSHAFDRLFGKFAQVPGVRGRRRGTGLGLPFCKLAVEAHGGRIWVDSEVGVGSTFALALPVGPSEFDQAPEALS